LDEGERISCTVTATDPSGHTASSTSVAVPIPVPHVAGCPAATGTLSGTHVGFLTLGMTRARARAADPHSSTHGRQSVDFFCLTPRGIRTGYPSTKLLATLAAQQRTRYENRVIWISTSSAHYAIDTVRPGASLAYARARLALSAPFQIGLNTWYLAPLPHATAVLKAQNGQIAEIGIAVKALTTGSRSTQRTFLSSFD
jgi:hypothetical protein